VHRFGDGAPGGRLRYLDSGEVVLPYKAQRSCKSPKRSRKAPIGGCRVKVPEIYVRVSGLVVWKSHYKRAHIRTRRGRYRYLVWRVGDKVQELYLGSVREVCPTLEARPRRRARSGAGLPSARRVGHKTGGAK
jgi:hypothetical protein